MKTRLALLVPFFCFCALGRAPLVWAAPNTTVPKASASKADPITALKKNGKWREVVSVLQTRLLTASVATKPALLGQLSDAQVEWAYQLAEAGDVEGTQLQFEASLEREAELAKLGKPRASKQFNLWFALARVQFFRHYPQDAIASTSQALNWAKTARSPQFESLALARRADYKRLTGDLGSALADARLALQRANACKDGALQVQALIVLSMVQVYVEQPTAALKNLGDALRLARTRRNEREQAEVLARLGTALSAKDRYVDALRYYRASLDLYRKLKIPDSQMAVMGNIGVVYQKLGRQEEALKLYDQGLLMAVLSGDKRDRAIMLTGLGTVYGQANQQARAIGYLQQALRIWRELGETDPVPVNLANIMDCYRVLKQPNIAIFYGKAALDAIEKERSSMATLSEEERRLYDQNATSYYRNLANLLISQNRLMEAEEVLRRLKTQEQSQWTRDAETEGGAPLARTTKETQTATKERDLADTVLKLARRAAELQRAPSPDAKAIQAVRTQLEAANRAYDAFLVALPATFKTEEQGQAAVEKIEGFSELKTALEANPDAVAVYTVVANDQFGVILFSSDAQVAFTSPVRAADLGAKVVQFRLALQDENVDPRIPANELYNIIFCDGKVRRELDALGAKTLLWSLDGALRLLPPGALYDGKQFLVRSFASVALTRTSVGEMPASASDWTALGLGATQAATVTGEQLGHGEGKFQFPSLKGVGEELKGIVRQPGEQEGLWTGERRLDAQFTKTAMLETLRSGQRFPLVHIASHFHCGTSPDDSFLLLGDGTPLTLSQLRSEGRTSKLFQGVELLTLSACQTGVASGAPGTAGREVDTLGAIAQGQGARAVLVSLWPISDSGTPELMRDFYALRRAHPEWTKAQTLQQAQIALLDGVALGTKPGDSSVVSGERAAFALPAGNLTAPLPQWTASAQAPLSHPRFWAPFVLLGNWK